MLNIKKYIKNLLIDASAPLKVGDRVMVISRQRLEAFSFTFHESEERYLHCDKIYTVKYLVGRGVHRIVGLNETDYEWRPSWLEKVN